MIGVHTKTAFGYVRRFPFQALAAMFVLGLTFFVTTILAVLMYSSNNVLSHFETRPQVIAFISEDSTPDQISSLQDKLSNDSRLDVIVYVSKEEAFGIYKESTSYNPLLSELVSPSTFPASLEFSLTDLEFAEEVIGELKNNEVVDQVGFTANLGSEDELSTAVGRLRNISYYMRVGGGALVLFQISTSLIVLLVIIGMRMAIRRNEIEILELLGATPGFIRAPIMIEAILYALMGVFLGWLFAFILVLYSTPSIISMFGTVPVLPKRTEELMVLFGLILAVELMIGIVLALMGSGLAVARARKRR
jgi:cell division transport system permease protein